MKIFAAVRLLFVVPLLVATLAWAQDLPEGDGRKLLQQGCTSCHDLDVIVSQHNSKDGWSSIVDDMIGRGAPLKDDEAKILVEYLAKNYPPDTKK
jgi:hypothetical protein